MDNNCEKKLKELLELTIQQEASDLHFSTGHPPVLRISGKLIPVPKAKKITSNDAQCFAYALMTEQHKERLPKEKAIDFSYNFEGKARFRVNVFFQRGDISCALRLIPPKIKTIEELNLPPILYDFTKANQGFVLVTGPANHGKSTTLAALINEINHNRADHIITIEDPIEYLFVDDKAIIDQRELYQDTMSFSGALKSAFRQDPDVIMVGEMRDTNTVSTAITAAETGHLVFATLHTNSAAQSVHRIIDSFPAEQQSQVRAQLSGSLLGVFSQRLIPAINGGLIPACEVMLNTPAVANLIRENRTHELSVVIETSGEAGMVSLNQFLADLVTKEKITRTVALSYSLNPEELNMLIKK
ncbi:MAG: type IV pilus twitching motility protein PilT [Patescibacteria group bacterium]|nr:type IV pilus twitching motility protein PilT [Patescibacteria group bacterium]